MASSGVSKRELLTFFYKYRRRLFLSFLIPFGLAVAVSFLPSPRFKADSVLIVRLGSEYVYQPEVGNSANGGVVIPFSQDQIFKSEVAILASDDLHAQVIQALGIERVYPDLIHPSKLAEKKAMIGKALNSLLATFGFARPEPVIEEGVRDEGRLAKAVQIFDSRFDILLEKESAVINISFEHKDATVAVDALNTLLTFYFEKRKQLYQEPRVAMAKTEFQSARSRALSASRAVEDFKREHQLYSLEDQRSELLRRRSEAQRQSTVISNPELARQIAQANQELDQLDALERQFNNLQKEAQIAEGAYDTYSRKMDDANSYEKMQRGRADSVRIIQQPVAPPEPKSLQLLIVLGGFFFASVFTLLVAAMTEFSRTGFLTPESLERGVNVPVLAVFPYRKRRV